MESPSKARKRWNSAFLMMWKTDTIRRNDRLNGGKSQWSPETSKFDVIDDLWDCYYSAEMSTKRWKCWLNGGILQNQLRKVQVINCIFFQNLSSFFKIQITCKFYAIEFIKKKFKKSVPFLWGEICFCFTGRSSSSSRTCGTCSPRGRYFNVGDTRDDDDLLMRSHVKNPKK